MTVVDLLVYAGIGTVALIAAGKAAGATGQEVCLSQPWLGLNVGVNCGKSDCECAGGTWSNGTCKPPSSPVTSIPPNTGQDSRWVCCRTVDPNCNVYVWHDSGLYYPCTGSCLDSTPPDPSLLGPGQPTCEAAFVLV